MCVWGTNIPLPPIKRVGGGHMPLAPPPPPLPTPVIYEFSALLNSMFTFLYFSYIGLYIFGVINTSKFHGVASSTPPCRTFCHLMLLATHCLSLDMIYFDIMPGSVLVNAVQRVNDSLFISQQRAGISPIYV